MEWLMMLIWGVNLVFITLVLFVEQKRPEVALCWLMALVFLPVVGCILYLFFGISLPHYQRRSLRRWQVGVERQATQTVSMDGAASVMVRMNEQLGEGAIRENNHVQILASGEEKYSSLLADIRAATSTIHLLYFIIRGDRLGHHLVQALTEKAQQGVRVRLLYDHGGSFFTSKEMFRPLVEAGGEVARFFPIRLGYYLRVNYRNHRKIVVIDGKIGYLGGMNIGEEYLGERIASQIPWRDLHLRIEGECVEDLQRRFVQDWQFAGRAIEKEIFLSEVAVRGGVAMQLVSSGPYRTEPAIKWNYLRMIYGATQSIWLQTPYFVPDEAFLEALRIAVKSKVEVRLILPSYSDNRPAQKVSVSYARELWRMGVKIGFYPGFVHAKLGIIDGRMVTLGTANLDRRSFSLNFETNAILYDEKIARRCQDLYQADWDVSHRMVSQAEWKMGVLQKAEESLWRLLTPLL